MNRIDRIPARRGLKLRWKIAGPYALLSLLLAAGGAFVLTRLMVGSLEERFGNQLIEAARVAADAVVRQEREHLTTVRTIAYTEGLPEAVAARQSSEVGAIALPIVENQHPQFVEVLDARGIRLFGAQREGAGYVIPVDMPERTSWPFVQRVLEGRVDATGDKFAGIVEVPAGLVLYSAGAIRAADGTTVGAVLVGTSLTAFAPYAKGQALADVTIFNMAGRPVATSFAVDLASAASDLEPALPGGSLSVGASAPQTLFGRDYQVLYNALRVRGEQWGWYSVALPRSFISSATDVTRVGLGLFFALATVAVLSIGWLLARTLTRPLGRLVSAADAVSHGDLSVRSGVRGGDEIGELAGAFDQMTERLQRNHLNTLSALVSSIDARDAYTRGHSVRVGHLAADLGRAMGLTSAELQHLQVGGMLHDIGKIGIRDNVLLKPGQLEPAERLAIQEHPRIGLSILERVDLPPEVIAGVGGHHERLNGSGYPRGLAGDQVSLFPRLIAVADVYDALITDRPYRAALPLLQVLRMLSDEVERGLLDQDAVLAMCRIAREWEVRRHNDASLDGLALDVSQFASTDALRMFVQKGA